jgi:predicted nucleic acid-binding protein
VTVKYFFDTSALVPAFLDDHLHHEASLAALKKAKKAQACCAAPTLAEVYSTLTRMPNPYRARAEEALLFLTSLRERFAFIALTSSEYWSAITKAAESGIAGGRIYDALLGACAIKANAEIIYTWDPAGFAQLGDDIAGRVRTP